uniref:vigilin-like n=1 Tax=Pristiophorus japonicus TaxID=55135 RepID=UPI00398F70C8
QVNSFTAEIRAKPEYHRFLIGRGGANIRKVRERTGARIVFPTAEDQEQELITIVGKEEGVRQAREQLAALIRDLELVVEDHMNIDPRYHRHFVSRRGQVLRELAEEYGGVAVSFPRTGVKSDVVTLKGAKECVEAAKKRIQDIVQELEAQVTMECVISQKFHRNLMGPKGVRVQQLARDHSVQIKFPDRGESGSGATELLAPGGSESGADVEGADRRRDTIILVGRLENCQAAEAALRTLIPVTAEVEIPYHLHRFIIGQRGSGIRKMMENYE